MLLFHNTSKYQILRSISRILCFGILLLTVSTPALAKKKTSKSATTVLIKTNVRATVYIDSIPSGFSNKPIEISPGNTRFTLKSPGYKTKKFQFNIFPNRQNTLAATMTRMTRPATQPAKKPPVATRKSYRATKAPPKAKTTRTVSKTNSSGRSTNKARARINKKSRMPKRDLVAEFQSDGAPPPPPKVKPSRSIEPNRFSYSSPSNGSSNRRYQAQPQPHNQGSRLHRHQGYEQQRYAQQPYHPARPSYAAPFPQSYGDVNYRKFRSYRLRRTTPKPPPLGVSLLPFGAGQYYNNDHLLGAFFTGSQILALYNWHQTDQLATRDLQKAKAIKDDPDYEIREEDNYESIQILNRKIEERALESQISLGIFFALWAWSSIDAIQGTPKEPLPPRRSKRLYYRTSSQKQSITPIVLANQKGLQLGINVAY